MSISSDVGAIQRAYPQVWFACHLSHRTRSTGDGLTDREAGILAHIDSAEHVRASDLADHLGIRKSTLSAQLQRLSDLGLVRMEPGKEDRRERPVRLTKAGRAAVTARSPLDAERVRSLLAELSADERAQAVAGLALLATAARKFRDRTAGKEAGK